MKLSNNSAALRSLDATAQQEAFLPTKARPVKGASAFPVKRRSTAKVSVPSSQSPEVVDFYRNEFRKYLKSQLPKRANISAYYRHLKGIWPTTGYPQSSCPSHRTLNRNLKALAHEIKGGMCTFPCNHTQSEDVLAVIREQFPHASQDARCPTCVSQQLVADNQQAKDVELKHRLMAVSNSSIIAYDGNVHNVDVDAVTRAHLSHKLCDTLDVAFGTVHIRVKELWDNYIPTNNEKNKVKGGFMPKDFDPPQQQVIGNPGDGTVGVVVWPTNEKKTERDFLMIGDLGLHNEDIVELGRAETKAIVGAPEGKRCGAAGGYRLPTFGTEFDSASMTHATKGFREMIATNTDGNTAVKLVYKNVDTGEIKIFESAYNDIHMNRHSGDEKKAAMAGCQHTIRKTIQEMRQRITSMAVCSVLKLLPGHEIKGLYKSLRDSHTKIARNVKGAKTFWEGAAYNLCIHLSMAQMVLLEWACGTGEMRNHMALACHEDSNKSHPLESYTLFGRVADNDNRDATSIRMEMVDGYLILVHVGVFVRVRCGLDAVHCNLRNTMHVADWSRNVHNWSWVHGP